MDLAVIISYPISNLRRRPFGLTAEVQWPPLVISRRLALWDASSVHMAIVPCMQGVVTVQKPQRQNPSGAGLTRLASDVGVLVFA